MKKAKVNIPPTQVGGESVLSLASKVTVLLESHPNAAEAETACRIAGELARLRALPGIRINTKVNEPSPA